MSRQAELDATESVGDRPIRSPSTIATSLKASQERIRENDST
jgi:hypothetical protein